MAFATGLPPKSRKTPLPTWQPRWQPTWMQHHQVGLQKLVLYDHIHITWTTAINISKDVAHCFDHMIEACMNLLCRQQGADINYLKPHALLQQSFQYYVKHVQGISANFNQHCNTDPWHRAGQGAGDACLRWIVQADSIIKAYESHAEPWTLYSPNYKHASYLMHLLMTWVFLQPNNHDRISQTLWLWFNQISSFGMTFYR